MKRLLSVLVLVAAFLGALPAAAVQLDQRGCMVYAAWAANVVWARDLGADKAKVLASVKSESGEPAVLLERHFDLLWATGMPWQLVAQTVYNECSERSGRYEEAMNTYPAFDYVRETVMPAALSLLPPKMDTREARANLLAIGLQESRFEHRRQINGPARSFWQAEEGGAVTGVMRHQATRDMFIRALEHMGYLPVVRDIYVAIEHNDVLACVLARLNLWWLPQRLSASGETERAWSQYIDAWRPGKPHRQTWDAFYDKAWQSV